MSLRSKYFFFQFKRIAFTAVIISLFCLSFIQPKDAYFDASRENTLSPNIALSASSNNTYPAANQALYAYSDYNFTAGMRNEGSMGMTVDSANLLIEKEGSQYSNSSLIPLGSHNASYSFTSDRSGGLADGFIYSGTGTSTVKESYLGHQKVLNIAQTNAAWYYVIANFTTSTTFSVWVCPVSTTTSNQIQLVRAGDGLVMGGVQFAPGNTLFAYDETDFKSLGIWAANRWYYVAIVANLTTKTYSVAIDGNSSDALEFYTQTGDMEITSLRVAMYQGESYVDAIDISSNIECQSQLVGGDIYDATNSFTSGAFTDGGWEQGTGNAEEHIEDVATAPAHDNCLSMEMNSTPDFVDGWSNFVLQKDISNSATWFNLSFWVLKTSIVAGFWLIRFVYSATEYCQIGSWKQYCTIRDPGVHDITSGISANYWCYFDLSLNFAIDEFYYHVTEFTPTATLLCTGTVNTGTMPQIDQLTLGISDATTTIDCYVDAILDSTDPDYFWRKNYDPLAQTGKYLNTTDSGELGVYNATDSFDGNELFDVPTGWTNASGANCRAFVAPQVPTGILGHKNILCLEDRSASGISQVTQSITSITTGSVEFWALSTDVTNHLGFRLGSGESLIGPYVYITTENVYAYTTSGAGVTLTSVTDNTFYHIRIAFDCTNDKYSVWVNGLLRGTLIAFNDAISSVDYVAIYTGLSSTSYQCYVDAIDLSSDVEYYPERSTYLRLNKTFSFPSTGSYSYHWQAWSSGTNFDGPITPFTVVPNAELYSESDVITKWIFMGKTGSVETLYSSTTFEDYKTNYWGYYGDWVYAYGDAPVLSAYPNTNFGTENWMNVMSGYEIFMDFGDASTWGDSYFEGYFLLDNITGPYNQVYWSYVAEGSTIEAYATTSFEEMTITDATKPAEGVLLESDTPTTGWYEYPASSRYVKLKSVGGGSSAQTMSTEYYDSTYWPRVYTYIAPFYAGVDKCYVQGYYGWGQSIISPTLSPINLQANDHILITYQTTTDQECKFLLTNGDVTVKTYSGESALIEQMNEDFTLHTKTYTIESALTIDGFRFDGQFGYGENLQITDIVIERYNYLTWQFYVNPQGRREVCLPTETLDLTIMEGPLMVWSEEQVVATQALNVIQYSPIWGGERQVNIYDQQNNPIDFAMFRVNLTRTLNNISTNFLMLSNRFYADDNSYYNLSVSDRFGNTLLTQTNYAIATFIDLQVTIYKLKVYNQCEKFAYANVSCNPDNGLFWSEWLAPGEIAAYYLYAGDYLVTIANQENSSTQYYDYTLAGDDYLLISSENTIWNTIQNIQNTNTTIGNQITAVNITISNQNSAINNSIVNVEINLSNINSTLGNQLVSIESSISNLETNMTVQFQSVIANITNINSTIISQFQALTAALVNVNSSIYTQIQDVLVAITNLETSLGDQIQLVNISLSNSLTDIENQVIAATILITNVNASISNQLVDISSAITSVNSTILSQFNLVNVTLTDLSNFINSSITGVNTAVYLVNNTIYTAVTAVGMQVNLTGNTINSSIFLVLNQSIQLSDLWNNALFRDNLTWSNNVTDILSQVYDTEIINQYRNESLTLYMQYAGMVEELAINALGTIESAYIPRNSTYRVWSVTNQEYLCEWTPLSVNATGDTATLDFGFYEEEMPVVITTDLRDFILFIVIVAFVGIGLVFLKAAQINAENKKIRQGKSKRAFSDNRVS